MILVYLCYVLALWLWTMSAITQEEFVFWSYFYLIVGLAVSGILIFIAWRKRKNLQIGPMIALTLANLGASIAFRMGEKSISGYLKDFAYMVICFLVVFLVVRFTKIYRWKLLNVLCIAALPMILYYTAFKGAEVNGSHLYFFGIMTLGIILTGYPFVVATFMASPEKHYRNGNVRNLSFNMMGLLIYTFLLFGGCALCNEYGLLLVLAMTATVIFFIRCNNWLTKMLYSAACLAGALLVCKVVSHVHDRVVIWLNLKAAVESEALAEKAETALYLFRNFKRMGFYGNGIGNLPESIYRTLNSDHVLVTVMNDYGLFMAIFMIVLGAVFVRWMLIEGKNMNTYDKYLNLSSALIVGFVILIHIASNLASFITAGLGYPWCSDGTSANVMFTILMAVHCGIVGRRGKNELQERYER